MAKTKLLFYSLAVILFLLDHGKTFIYYKLLSSDPNFCDAGRQNMVEVTTAPTCSHIIRVTVNKGNRVQPRSVSVAQNQDRKITT